MALTGVMEVPPADREVLEGWLHSPSIRAGLAQRARIVLLAADGLGTNAIAERVGAAKQMVIIANRVVHTRADTVGQLADGRDRLGP
jgi:hypothetical protein